MVFRFHARALVIVTQHIIDNKYNLAFPIQKIYSRHFSSLYIMIAKDIVNWDNIKQGISFQQSHAQRQKKR